MNEASLAAHQAAEPRQRDFRGKASMNVEELIERDPGKAGGVAVFTGTRIPVAFLFDFLNDDQTVETFLDQYPTVSRDQARGVLSASRDLLLKS